MGHSACLCLSDLSQKKNLEIFVAVLLSMARGRMHNNAVG